MLMQFWPTKDFFIHCKAHTGQGKYTNTGKNYFQMSKENLTEPGLEPKTSGLMYQHSYQLSYPAQYWVPSIVHNM